MAMMGGILMAAWRRALRVSGFLHIVEFDV